MSRDELIVVVARQAEQLAARDRQIAEMAGQLAELMEANEALAAKLARLEHLLSRNSGNSSSPPSRDDDPGKPRGAGEEAAGAGRRGRGASSPARRGRIWRGPTTRTSGATGSRRGAAAAAPTWPRRADLGVVDRYQQHEIPQVAVRVTQYDQHQVACGVRRGSTPPPAPTGPGPGRSGTARTCRVRGVPDGGAVHSRAPGGRAAGVADRAAPSVGFVHGMLARTAGLLAEVHDRIRTLITLAYAVCCDETPLRVGPEHPAAGQEEGRAVPAGGLHRALHPLPARRPLPGHVQGVRCSPSWPRRAVIVHDRYQNYDSAELGELVHQLCCRASAARP